MIIFIDLGKQIDKNKPPRFAFYSTILGQFEEFNNKTNWETIEEFKADFKRIYGDCNPNLPPIPKRFSEYYKPFEGLADALNELYTGSISKDDVIIAQPLHGAHLTAPLVLGYLDDFEIETEIDEQNGGMTVTKIERKEANE